MTTAIHKPVQTGLKIGYYKPRPAIWSTIARDINATTPHEALSQAGLDWQVSKIGLLTHDARGEFNDLAVPHHSAIVRNDTHKTLGVVGSSYEIIQNLTPVEMLFDLTRQRELKFEIAGSMAEGAFVYLFARIPHNIKVGDDNLKFYMVLHWSHTGSHALACYFRITDENTNIIYNVSLPGYKALKDDYRFKHTKNSDRRIRELVDVYEHGTEFREEASRILNTMAATAWDVDMMNGFLEDLFPVADTERAETQRDGQRQEIMSVFSSDGSSIGGTAFGALKAVTYWVDTTKKSKTFGKNVTKNTENELTSALFDAKATLKQKAFVLLKKKVS